MHMQSMAYFAEANAKLEMQIMEEKN
jgi:hypothetical protein